MSFRALEHVIVYPETTQYAVNADMEIKYVLKRSWVVKR